MTMGSPRKASSRAMYKASSIAGDDAAGAGAAVAARLMDRQSEGARPAAGARASALAPGAAARA